MSHENHDQAVEELTYTFTLRGNGCLISQSVITSWKHLSGKLGYSQGFGEFLETKQNKMSV